MKAWKQRREERKRKEKREKKKSGGRMGESHGTKDWREEFAWLKTTKSNSEKFQPLLPALQIHTQAETHTWSTVVLLHPDVAVALGNAGLGVQEGETHGAFGTQTGIVAAAVFNGLFVELLSETGIETRRRRRKRSRRRRVMWMSEVKDRGGEKESVVNTTEAEQH